MWTLLRIWHVETLDFIAHRADACTFFRTSYCVAPERWHALAREELDARVAVLLHASYAKRNYVSRRSGDHAEMCLIAYDHEWVPAAGAAAEPPADGADLPGLSVLDPRVHAALKASAHLCFRDARAVARPGIAARPWAEGFSAFRIDADGETWHLVRYLERDALFDARLLGAQLRSAAS